MRKRKIRETNQLQLSDLPAPMIDYSETSLVQLKLPKDLSDKVKELAQQNLMDQTQIAVFALQNMVDYMLEKGMLNGRVLNEQLGMKILPEEEDEEFEEDVLYAAEDEPGGEPPFPIE